MKKKQHPDHVEKITNEVYEKYKNISYNFVIRWPVSPPLRDEVHQFLWLEICRKFDDHYNPEYGFVKFIFFVGRFAVRAFFREYYKRGFNMTARWSRKIMKDVERHSFSIHDNKTDEGGRPTTYEKYFCENPLDIGYEVIDIGIDDLEFKRRPERCKEILNKMLNGEKLSRLEGEIKRECILPQLRHKPEFVEKLQDYCDSINGR